MQRFNGLQKLVINMDEDQFEEVALEIFRYQAQGNLVYKEFIKHLDLDPREINQVKDIPFLPIEMFKHRKVTTGTWDPQMIFTSSGTGNMDASQHFVRDLQYYQDISAKIFENFYGSPERYHILALLPSYLERSGSSLVHMLDHLIKASGSSYSGFYLRDYQGLIDHLHKLQSLDDKKIMLWGVSFALLDLAEILELDLSEAVIVETGGMKGQREEIIREDLHERLIKSFKCNQIQSEYGMAELSSQAYTVKGQFQTPAWMRILIRDISDPFEYVEPGRAGGINVIDLANIHSCAFIETQDLGTIKDHNRFSVLGRIDNAEVRGCNLLV